MKTIFLSGLLITSSIFISGCAGNGGPSFTQVGMKDGKMTQVTKEDVNLKTKMSASIFLEPVAPEKQVVFIKVRNTSDKDFDMLKSYLENNIKSHGWNITNNPSKANFMIQANILVADRIQEKGQLGGAALGMAAAGAGVGAYNHVGSARDTAAGALIGGLIGAAIESAEVKPVSYAMVTDVEIRQRPLEGEKVIQNDATNHQQGIGLNNPNGNNGNYSSQTSTNNNVKWKKYRTKITSSAKGAGLQFKQVKKMFEKELAKSITNML